MLSKVTRIHNERVNNLYSTILIKGKCCFLRVFGFLDWSSHEKGLIEKARLQHRDNKIIFIVTPILLIVWWGKPAIKHAGQHENLSMNHVENYIEPVSEVFQQVAEIS